LSLPGIAENWIFDGVGRFFEKFFFPTELFSAMSWLFPFGSPLVFTRPPCYSSASFSPRGAPKVFSQKVLPPPLTATSFRHPPSLLDPETLFFPASLNESGPFWWGHNQCPPSDRFFYARAARKPFSGSDLKTFFSNGDQSRIAAGADLFFFVGPVRFVFA